MSDRTGPGKTAIASMDDQELVSELRSRGAAVVLFTWQDLAHRMSEPAARAWLEDNANDMQNRLVEEGNLYIDETAPSKSPGM